MIQFRDKTFCSAQCAFTACHRNKRNVPADTRGLPVAYCDFSRTCPQYEPVVKQEVDRAEVA